MAPVTWQDDVFYQMLKSSAYIVTDPETADYFYLPIYIYWWGQGPRLTSFMGSVTRCVMQAHAAALAAWACMGGAVRLPVADQCVCVILTRRSLIKVADVAAHLRKAGPWFERKKGADHIFAVSGDFGR